MSTTNNNREDNMTNTITFEGNKTICPAKLRALAAATRQATNGADALEALNSLTPAGERCVSEDIALTGTISEADFRFITAAGFSMALARLTENSKDPIAWDLIHGLNRFAAASDHSGAAVDQASLDAILAA